MSSHKQNFVKAINWTEKLRGRYLHTLATFRIFERFQKLSAPNIVGKKKAEVNAKLFSNHVYFFMPIKESSRIYFFIELAKFFDKNRRKQSLTISYLLDFADNNFSSFSKEEFQKYHSKRYFLPDLFQYYIPITHKDIQKIRGRLRRNKSVIKNLNTYRDKFLAHDDLDKVQIHITGVQIKVLLRIVKDTIDLFYQKLEFASTMYDNYDKEPVRAVDRVVKNLQEHETERMRKIMEKYKL